MVVCTARFDLLYLFTPKELDNSNIMHQVHPFVFLKCCADELSTGLSSVVLKALTFDLLFLMLRQYERCIPCRSQKTNDGLTQSFSRAAINLHFLFRAKGICHWLGTIGDDHLGLCSVWCFFAVCRLCTCVCVCAHKYTRTDTPSPFPSCHSLFVELGCGFGPWLTCV